MHPTYPFVGRMIKVIRDPSRVETYNEDDNRVFPVSIFYPTRQSSADIGEISFLSLFNPAVDTAKDVLLDMGIEEEALESISIFVQDNAVPDLSHSFPVVILSPGFGIDRDLYMETVTSVVQSGYVAVSVGSPYDSFLTVYPDGNVVLQAERHPGSFELVQTRQQDIRLAIDYLERWNQEDTFHEMFDLNRIGLMGHSLGGATVFEFAARDKRIRCVILFDASLHWITDQVPNVPVLNMRREASSWEDDAEIGAAYVEKQKWLYDHLTSTKSFLKIIGATHLSFSTVGRLIGVSPPNVTSVIQEITLAFLNEFLNEDEGAYFKFIHGVDRPSEVVEIDGLGHQL